MDTDVGRSAVFIFHGVEYVVNISVNENQLTIEIEDRSTCDQWRNVFDAAYIEDVTFKTGNFKKFSVFAEMLESALAKTSDSVSLDLLTYADLELLREQKSGPGTRAVPNSRTASSSQNNRKYLIVTYTVEFDRVHYPLPLPYVGKPDPHLLQSIIQQLKQDIRALKQQSLKDYRIKEVELLKRDFDKLLKEKEAIQVEYLDFKRQVELTTDGVATKEVRMLKSVIKNLEEELTVSRTKHQRSTAKRNQQYQQLSEELEEVKASERNLKIRVKSLTNELAQYKRKGSRAFPVMSSRLDGTSRNNQRDNSGSRLNSYSRGDTSARSSILSHNRSGDKNLSRLSGSSVRSRDRSSSFERPPSVNRGSSLRARSLSNERDRSLSRDRNAGGDVPSGISRLRIISPSGLRYPRFDPTAYKSEKDRRRQEIELKQKRTLRVRMSNSSRERSRKSNNSWNSVDFAGHQRRSSRSPSISSLRSLASSIDSLSDSGMRSDSSEFQRRKAEQVLKSGKALLASSDDWSRSNGARNRSSTGPKPKVLSSTPETVVRTQSRLNSDINKSRDRAADAGHHDRSFELSEIDERLSRLQQFMKDNLQ